MDRKIAQVITFLWIVSSFIACKKENNDNQPPPTNTGKKVFVVCEGSMGNGNSSLLLYKSDTDSIYEAVYRTVNHHPLGDVFQSMIRIGDQYFLCINNSDKILAIDATTFELNGIIHIPKPRFILPVNNQKAYVSSLFNNTLFTIDPSTLQITATIELPFQNPEGLLFWNDKVVICCWDTACSSVLLMDPTTNAITSTIAITGSAPQEAVVDKEGNLWVVAGNRSKGKPCTLLQIGATQQILNSFSFSPEIDLMKPVLNITKDTLYFITANLMGGTQYNGIFRTSIYATQLPDQPFISAQPYQYFWALGMEPMTGNIWIGDPKGFIQKGSVQVYQSNGEKIREFQTGVGPGRFYFDY